MKAYQPGLTLASKAGKKKRGVVDALRDRDSAKCGAEQARTREASELIGHRAEA